MLFISTFVYILWFTFAYLHHLKLLGAAGRQLFLYKMFILLDRNDLRVEDTTPPDRLSQYAFACGDSFWFSHLRSLSRWLWEDEVRGPSFLCLLLLVCSDGDITVRVQHHLSTADYGHQQEEAEQEEEEEGKTKVHIHFKPGNGEGWRVHVDKSTESICSSVVSSVYFPLNGLQHQSSFTNAWIAPKPSISSSEGALPVPIHRAAAVSEKSTLPPFWLNIHSIPLCLGLFFFSQHRHLLSSQS